VPDTITSWIITAFSVDPVHGLALTKLPSKLNVFQPFFVSTNLPYSIKRGEVVAIPISVFNYLELDTEVDVTLFNSEQEFDFVDVNEDEDRVRRKRGLEAERKKKTFVKSNEGSLVTFMIKPLKVGYIKIKASAESDIAGDGVERYLLVEPEGVTKYENKAILIDLRNSQNFNTKIAISVPPNVVSDSVKIEASATGDVMGPTLENLDKLM
jgi:CD109 antigen